MSQQLNSENYEGLNLAVSEINDLYIRNYIKYQRAVETGGNVI